MAEPEAASPPPAPHDPYAALRFPNFRLLFGGGVLSATGAQMLGMAVGWELYDRTGEAWSLGLIGLVLVIPILAFSLPAGHVADRYNRRAVLVGAQILRLAASITLTYLSFTGGPVDHYYAALFALGTARAFGAPARGALMPLLVPAEHFANAVTWNSSGFQLATVLGPALGGLIIAQLGGAGFVYATDSITTLVNLSCLLALRVPSRGASRETLSLASLAGGLKFVWSSRLVFAAITLDLFAVLLGGATALLPIYAKDILGVGASGLGWLRAAPAVGALVMALTLAHRPPMQRAGRVLLWSVAGFGAATVIFGLSTSFALSLAMLFVTGVLDNVSVVVRHTLITLRTPDEMRGRVSAVNSIFISASNELGEFESGLVAHHFGTVASVVSGGIGTILVVLGVRALWPILWNLKSLHEERAAQNQSKEPASPST